MNEFGHHFLPSKSLWIFSFPVAQAVKKKSAHRDCTQRWIPGSSPCLHEEYNLRRREKSRIMQTYNSALKKKVTEEPNLISEVEKGFLEEVS